MKNNYIITLLFITAITQAQIVDIPDANFKNALVNTDCVDTNGDGYGDDDADTNDDGEIQLSEAEAVLWLKVSFRNITLLEGVQSFTNLETLICYSNGLNSLDFAQNNDLVELVCYSNNLTSLNITQNVNLEKLICYDNQLSSLDVSQNINLEELVCFSNQQLTSLNVTQNVNLLKLNCAGNSITNLDLTQNTNLQELVCDNNQLTNLDITQNINLEELVCGGNPLTSIDVTQNINLNKLVCIFNQLTSLDLSQNNNLSYLSCRNNQLTHLDVYQNNNLKELFCNNNQLASLDVSQNMNLEELFCNNNQLVNLNIKNGNNTNMPRMWSHNNLNLVCIQIDDDTATYPECTSTSGWCKDDWAEYNEECELGIEGNSIISFSIYPNPTQDVLNIASQQPIETVKIYNLQGQLIKEGSSNRVDVSQLNTGLYFIQLSVDGKTVTKKFIKE